MHHFDNTKRDLVSRMREQASASGEWQPMRPTFKATGRRPVRGYQDSGFPAFDAAVRALAPNVHHDDNEDGTRFPSPAYGWPIDMIRVPHRADYQSDSHYAHDMAHELAHWTGPRLNRTPPYGGDTSMEYAREELVAETTAAIVLDALGVPFDRDRTAHYLTSFLLGGLHEHHGVMGAGLADELRDAFALADQAADYILTAAAKGSAAAT